jgi:predicted Zn-dependent protease
VFEVRLIEADQPNAFALPGGAIVVTTALLKAVGDYSGLLVVDPTTAYRVANLRSLRRSSKCCSVGAEPRSSGAIGAGNC